MASGDHDLYQCWQKIRDNTTDSWVYNRWGYVTKADYPAGYFNVAFTDFTYRTMPWSGTAGRLSSILDVQPRGSRSCSGSFQLSAGGWVSLGTDIDCDELVTNLYPSSKQFRLFWSGWDNRDTLHLDGLGIYADNTSSGLNPRFSDYVFFQISSGSYLGNFQVDDGGVNW